MLAHDEALELAAVAAIGALPVSDLAELRAHIADCANCREELRADIAAASLLAASEDRADVLDPARAERMKAGVMRVVRGGESQSAGYATMVPRDRLRQFGPGVWWAVMPGQGATTVYWIFDPPKCGDLPLETHRHAQTGVVLAGRAKLEFGDGTTRIMRKGDCFTIGPHVAHGGIFYERTIFVDVYSPNHRTFERMYEECAVGEPPPE